jgi:hypothetical protein
MKITKLLMLVAAVILFSCGKDDDPKPGSDSLVGTWAITALNYEGTSTTSVQGVSVTANFTGTGKDMNLKTTFGKDPNTVTNQGSYTIVLTTSTQGQTVTEEYTYDEVITNGTWALNGSKITVTTADGPQEATIVEQTASTLKLKVEENESETQQGVTVAVVIKGTYTFQKQ